MFTQVPGRSRITTRRRIEIGGLEGGLIGSKHRSKHRCFTWLERVWHYLLRKCLEPQKGLMLGSSVNKWPESVVELSSVRTAQHHGPHRTAHFQDRAQARPATLWRLAWWRAAAGGHMARDPDMWANPSGGEKQGEATATVSLEDQALLLRGW